MALYVSAQQGLFFLDVLFSTTSYVSLRAFTPACNSGASGVIFNRFPSAQTAPNTTGLLYVYRPSLCTAQLRALSYLGTLSQHSDDRFTISSFFRVLFGNYFLILCVIVTFHTSKCSACLGIMCHQVWLL